MIICHFKACGHSVEYESVCPEWYSDYLHGKCPFCRGVAVITKKEPEKPKWTLKQPVNDTDDKF